MVGRHRDPEVVPLIHRDSVLAETEHLSDPLPVDKPPTTRPRAVDDPLPERGQPPAERGRARPKRGFSLYNILWLIDSTERYMLWFWP